MRLSWLLIASFLICVPAQAEEKSGDAVDYQAVLAMLTELVGGSVNTKTESGQRVVSIAVDRSTVNRDFGKLRFEKAKRDPDIAINDPDRAKLIKAANFYAAAVARGDSLALGMVSRF